MKTEREDSVRAVNLSNKEKNKLKTMASTKMDIVPINIAEPIFLVSIYKYPLRRALVQAYAAKRRIRTG